MKKIWSKACWISCKHFCWSWAKALRLWRGKSICGWKAKTASSTWFFYNYLLKCFVLVDLKVGKLAHQDVGQMDMYVRVFDEQHRQEGDNPTLGLILCSERNAAVAKYSLLADKAQLFASKYQAVMPTEAELQAELERDRALLEID